MRHWLPYRSRYLDIILDLEAPVDGRKCAQCGEAQSKWRCEDCHSKPLYCDTCIRESHQRSPFHRILKWNGRCFLRAALWQTGLVLHLGHAGMPCPRYFQPMTTQESSGFGGHRGMREEGEVPGGDEEGENEEEGNDEEEWIDEDRDELRADNLKPPKGVDAEGNPWLLIVHTSGVHYLRARYCQCSNHMDHHEQLLANHLYPASIKRPSTVFTFQVLDDFYLENLECKTAARNYFSKLRRLTSKLFPHLVAV